MIDAGHFIAAALQRGFGLYTGVPCSYLTPFINHAINSGALRYIAAANEGDAVAIAAGAELGGRPAVVMFQNSGLGNTVNPLTSLTWTFRIPVLLIDNRQHESTGGQATVSAGVDFCAIAAGAGYPSVMAAARAADVQALLADRTPVLRFLHVPVLPGVPAGLPRPAMPPAAVAERFRASLGPREVPA